MKVCVAQEGERQVQREMHQPPHIPPGRAAPRGCPNTPRRGRQTPLAARPPPTPLCKESVWRKALVLNQNQKGRMQGAPLFPHPSPTHTQHIPSRPLASRYRSCAVAGMPAWVAMLCHLATSHCTRSATLACIAAANALLVRACVRWRLHGGVGVVYVAGVNVCMR